MLIHTSMLCVCMYRSAPTVKTLNIAPTTAQGESVVAMTVSCQGQLLAVCTSEKRLVVWECQHWRVRGER